MKRYTLPKPQPRTKSDVVTSYNDYLLIINNLMTNHPEIMDGFSDWSFDKKKRRFTTYSTPTKQQIRRAKQEKYFLASLWHQQLGMNWRDVLVYFDFCFITPINDRWLSGYYVCVEDDPTTRASTLENNVCYDLWDGKEWFTNIYIDEKMMFVNHSDGYPIGDYCSFTSDIRIKQGEKLCV